MHPPFHVFLTTSISTNFHLLLPLSLNRNKEVLNYCGTGRAQDDPQKTIDKFFDLYKNKSANEAVDYIFSTNKWISDSKDQVESVKFKLNGTLQLLGDYAGYNLITKKSVEDHLALYTYMVRYDRQPLRFSLLFYKASNEWKLLNFSYDDNLDEELQEASKAYRLKQNLEY